MSERLPDKMVVLYGQSETKTQYRPHDGRDEHGTDDDGNAIHIQSYRSNDDGTDKNEHIGTLKPDVVADCLTGALTVEVVGHIDQPQYFIFQTLVLH